MTAEEWRPVVGFPRYSVSSNGRVVSYCKPEPRILRATRPAKGYPQVVMHPGGGVGATRNVHQLVAEAFLGPRPAPGCEIRHLNGDSLDSRLCNLAWGTASENARDKRLHGTDHNVTKTHCPKGHPYDAENTYCTPSRPTHRYCRACSRATAAERQRNYRIRQSFRAAGVAA